MRNKHYTAYHKAAQNLGYKYPSVSFMLFIKMNGACPTYQLPVHHWATNVHAQHTIDSTIQLIPMPCIVK